MFDVPTVERIANSLLKNLDLISETIKDVNSSTIDKVFKGELYDRLTISFGEKDGIDYECGLNQSAKFSPRAHSLLTETQSQLNVLCSDLGLQPISLVGDIDNRVSAEPANIVLHKAYAVVSAAKELARISSTS